MTAHAKREMARVAGALPQRGLQAVFSVGVFDVEVIVRGFVTSEAILL